MTILVTVLSLCEMLLLSQRFLIGIYTLKTRKLSLATGESWDQNYISREIKVLFLLDLYMATLIEFLFLHLSPLSFSPFAIFLLSPLRNAL